MSELLYKDKLNLKKEEKKLTIEMLLNKEEKSDWLVRIGYNFVKRYKKLHPDGIDIILWLGNFHLGKPGYFFPYSNAKKFRISIEILE